MERKTEDQIRHTCRIKYFPSKREVSSVEIMAASRPFFRESGWEVSNKWDSSQKLEALSTSRKAVGAAQDSTAESPAAYAGEETNLERSARRARSKLRDLALANLECWNCFVTLTLDREKVDRYDMQAITRKLNNWLSNEVARRGLIYALVPERHKDGAIHFHGFFGGLQAGDMVPSGTWTRDGWGKPRRPRTAQERREWQEHPETYHEVFNLPRWPLGFTTAIKLYGSRMAAVAYVLKYVGKQQQGQEPEKIGGRWYYSGGALRRPEVEYLDLDFREVEALPGAFSWAVEEAGAAFAVVRKSVDNVENSGA